MKTYVLHCNLTCRDTETHENFYSRPTTSVRARNESEAMRKAEADFKSRYENFRTEVASVGFALIKEVES